MHHPNPNLNLGFLIIELFIIKVINLLGSLALYANAHESKKSVSAGTDKPSATVQSVRNYSFN